MKFKTFIAIYKNIIILLWWITVLVAFKIINNFEFKNGTSLIFIGLLIIFPLTLYILSIIRKIRLMKIKAINNGPYIKIIEQDVKTKKFEKEFLEELEDISLEFIEGEEIELKNELLQVVFTNEYAYIKLNDKKVIYRYYYVNKFLSYTKYDNRYLQYYPTTHLYALMIERIKELSNNEYIYVENRRSIKLINKKTEEVIYNLKKEKGSIFNR